MAEDPTPFESVIPCSTKGTALGGLAWVTPESDEELLLMDIVFFSPLDSGLFTFVKEAAVAWIAREMSCFLFWVGLFPKAEASRSTAVIEGEIPRQNPKREKREERRG